MVEQAPPQLTLWLSGARARAGAREGRLGGRGGLASAVPRSSAPSTAPSLPPGQRGSGERHHRARRGCCFEEESRVWGLPERSGAGRLMSRVEEAQQGPTPLCARSSQGAAGEAWERDQAPAAAAAPHLLAEAGAGAWGQPQGSQLFPTLAKERNTPHVSLIPFDFSNSYF